ncbi:hypothetical protein T484DRAFT_1804802 [Baffinella frigidus]|nr:hypothetical protein T484DRAFT_1804802 [Cryptophyta sp. CCMP2293]
MMQLSRPSVRLMTLIACTSLATGYAFAPALRAPRVALRGDSTGASEACSPNPPRVSGGLSALSMAANQKPSPSSGGGGGSATIHANWEEGWTAQELIELSHMEAAAEKTGGAHVLRAWVRTEVRAWETKREMEGKIARQATALEEKGRVIEDRDLEIASLTQEVHRQQKAIAGLQRRAEALTGVFTCATNSGWNTCPKSPPYTFTDGNP